METSILDSTKKILGIEPSLDVFDLDVITFINSSLVTLTQLGIGPPEGFAIEDNSAQWDEFIGGDIRYNMIQSFVFLRVSMLFDPPQAGYLVDAKEKQLRELEWRLSVMRDDIQQESA